MSRCKLSFAKSRRLRGCPKSFVGNGFKPFPTGVAAEMVRLPDNAADACLPRPQSGPGPVGRGIFQQPAEE